MPRRGHGRTGDSMYCWNDQLSVLRRECLAAWRKPVWNVMYDDFLRMNLPAGTSIFGFAGDALVVCAADDVRFLELTINKSRWRAKRWLDSRYLCPGKWLIGGGKEGDLSTPQGAYLYKQPAGNRSREGGHPQGWKAQTRREMADEMAWWPIREMDTPSNLGARHLAG